MGIMIYFIAKTRRDNTLDGTCNGTFFSLNTQTSKSSQGWLPGKHPLLYSAEKNTIEGLALNLLESSSVGGYLQFFPLKIHVAVGCTGEAYVKLFFY